MLPQFKKKTWTDISVIYKYPAHIGKQNNFLDDKWRTALLFLHHYYKT